MSHDEGATCSCCAEHRPPVLEYQFHHVLPLSLGGPDVEANLVTLCPSAHVNTHELMRLMFAARRSLTDYELQVLEDRPVSRYAAALARKGYTQAVLGLP